MADTRRISITEALVELKLYDAKIDKAINNSVFVGAKKKSSDKVGVMNESNFIAKAAADYQSIMDLKKNKRNLKSAVVQSNANTTVEIGGSVYTVAAAIEYKKDIENDKYLLQVMKEQWNKAVNTVARENLKVEAQVDKMLETFLGKDSDKKVNETDLSAISDPYREKNEYELVDPIDLYSKIEKLENLIDTFLAEVDVRLSVSNSVTYIEI